jgi:hypothetical protein
MNRADLPGAIAASFTSRGDRAGAARGLFGPASWWAMKTSAARWYDFVRESRGQDVPRNLTQVVAEVEERLRPVLECLP